MTALSVVMVTKGEEHAHEFIKQARVLTLKIGADFVIGADGCEISSSLADLVVPVESAGYLESVLDDVLSWSTGRYILRLDDDETVSEAMAEWLETHEYEACDVWAFPRANLRDEKAITTPPLWPDLQTRLTTREKAGGRKQIHQGSPHGTGRVAPVAILHHKFQVRSFDERLQIAAKYESVKPGAGFGHIYQPFNLPERCFDKVTVQDIGDGSVPNWETMTGNGQEVNIGS